jgi:hypothetical protein
MAGGRAVRQRLCCSGTVRRWNSAATKESELISKETRKHYERMNRGLRETLSALDQVMTVKEKIEVTEFVDVGEYGLALETLAALIVEDGKRIPRNAYDQIRELAMAMEIEDSVLTPGLRACIDPSR